MMTRLTPEQISEFWPIIKYAIEESLPPTTGEHPDKMNRILASALNGVLDVWTVYEREEDVKLEAVLLTKLTFDDASNTINLLLYCLYGYEDITNEFWKDGFDKLVEYARAKKCSRIVAYSSIPHIIKMAENFGADTSYTFISFDLSKSVL